MALTLADVEAIARLARIALNADEAAQTLAQLNGIFAVIERMQDTPTDGVEPLATPLAAVADVALRLREDSVTEEDRRADFQKVAPAVEDGLYLVPRVIGESA